MSKVFTFVTITVCLFAILTVTNIATNSSTSQLLQALAFDDPSGIQTADFYSIFFSPSGLIAIVGLLGGIVASLIRGGTWYWMAILGLMGTIAGWVVGDMYSIFWQSSQALAIFPWMGQGLKVIFVTWVAGFIISIVSYIGGSD